jgi:hypothetical protein
MELAHNKQDPSLFLIVEQVFQRTVASIASPNFYITIIGCVLDAQKNVLIA